MAPAFLDIVAAFELFLGSYFQRLFCGFWADRVQFSTGLFI